MKDASELKHEGERRADRQRETCRQRGNGGPLELRLREKRAEEEERRGERRGRDRGNESGGRER